MPAPWTIDSTMVPYRVYWVIFLRPISPSFDSFSRYGQMTVRSWRMIDAEMYGMIPSAKIVRRRRFPPTKRSARPNKLPPWREKNSSSATGSIPGVGRWAPTR